MAFKRTSFSALKSNRKETFESAYKFRKKVNDFKVGSDVYVIPLGLETGFYETPCHRIETHEVDGQTVGFGNSGWGVNIKCKGIDEYGNRQESLCCKIAKMEKDRFPDRNDLNKRIINFSTAKVHLPVLILGNSLGNPAKTGYPIQKVSILNELSSDTGLRFSFLEMAASTFRKDIVNAYGKKLKEDGVLDYEMDENSEEYLDIIRQHLTQTVIKIHGIEKQGFTVALQEYSFFPFSNPAIASQSPAGEREAIVGYRNVPQISNKVAEYLQLFECEVDNLVRDWSDSELQEYYNSVIGANLKANIEQPQAAEEKVELIMETPIVQPQQMTQPMVQQPVVETPVAVQTVPQQWTQPQVMPQQQWAQPQQQWTQPQQMTQPMVQQPVVETPVAVQTVTQPQVAPQPVAVGVSAQPVAQQTMVQQPVVQPMVQQAAPTHASFDSFLEDPFNGQDPVGGSPVTDVDLESFEFDMDSDESFLQ